MLPSRGDRHRGVGGGRVVFGENCPRWGGGLRRGSSQSIYVDPASEWWAARVPFPWIANSVDEPYTLLYEQQLRRGAHWVNGRAQRRDAGQPRRRRVETVRGDAPPAPALAPPGHALSSFCLSPVPPFRFYYAPAPGVANAWTTHRLQPKARGGPPTQAAVAR